MQKKMWLDFPRSISDIAGRNKSFDTCTLHVMYTGVNRNRTSISREAVEAAIPTLYNCPIVCHYMVEEDRIGGHDVEIVHTENGAKMINLTDAVGLIPEGAQYHWETMDDGGADHEYLVVDGILWKRSSAYDKLKRDGISGQSMEITVNNGETVDGIFKIYDFDFTAFCILGEDVEPCFESADIETFSLGVYKSRFERMMEDLKKEYSIAASADAGSGNEFSLKGGEGKVDLTELMNKYGLVASDISFATDGMSKEEIEAKFAEIKALKYADGDPEAPSGNDASGNDAPSNDAPGNDAPGGDTPGSDTPGSEPDSEPAGDDTPSGGADDPADQGGGSNEAGSEAGNEAGTDVNSDDEDDASGAPSTAAKRNDNFAMAGQVGEELRRALSNETFHNEFWNEDWRRYWYIDHDADAQKVYAEDARDDVICGFAYSMNGDSVVVDFASYKRQKVQFVDFDEGETVQQLFTDERKAMQEMFSAKMEKATERINELQKFHDETVAAQRREELEQVFASFGDLSGNESFEALRENSGDLTAEEVTEKCYAIRGRSMKVNFSANQPAAVRLPIDRAVNTKDEPYNGVFARYGY